MMRDALGHKISHLMTDDAVNARDITRTFPPRVTTKTARSPRRPKYRAAAFMPLKLTLPRNSADVRSFLRMLGRRHHTAMRAHYF